MIKIMCYPLKKVLSNSGDYRTGSNMSYILPQNGEHKYLSYIFHPHMLPNSGEHMICLICLNNFQFNFYLHFCPEDPKILPDQICCNNPIIQKLPIWIFLVVKYLFLNLKFRAENIC